MLLSYLSQTKRDTYVAFQIEKKSLGEISVSRGLVESTLATHLSEAILVGLTVDLNRLNMTQEIVDQVESIIRKAPINSSISFFYFLSFLFYFNF